VPITRHDRSPLRLERSLTDAVRAAAGGARPVDARHGPAAHAFRVIEILARERHDRRARPAQRGA
jgi:hypothetical protein